VLKAWVRCGIARGVDGFITNYLYRHDCHCERCVSGFRQYLRERFTAQELQQGFAISNLDTHQFEEIVGWHDPAQSTPLRREMLRFSQIANKRAFDEVFVQFGRSLKPDLIVAQWNHLGDFNQVNGDERCLLPGELWGKDEDYLWYSTGDMANHTDLASGVLGEGTLQARYEAVLDCSHAHVVATNVLERLPSGLSHFEAPPTVRVSASRPADGNEITLHFVNYNRQEPADKKNRSSGAQDEKPIAAPACQTDLKLASRQRATRVEFLTPEAEPARALEFEQAGGRLRFRVPEFLVYGVVRVHLSNVE